MKTRILFCWLGTTDLKAALGVVGVGLGPIGQAAQEHAYNEVVLLNNWERTSAEDYIAWLKKRAASKIILRQVQLSGPTNFGEIYQVYVNCVSRSFRSP